MSHQPERKEKNCLNCGTTVAGRYCQKCGQENIVPHQNFWGLTKHFVYDIFHFDGKFFETLKYLVLRPGRLSKEYIQGKRVHFLDPIRMYLFTSAVFFLVFFSMDDIAIFKSTGDTTLSRKDRFAKGLVIMENTSDSLRFDKLKILFDTTRTLAIEEARNDSPLTDTSFVFQEKGKNYVIAAKKDILSDDDIKPDNWFEAQLKQSLRKKQQLYGDDVKKITEAVTTDFLHKLPYMLFISLPVFALILKLLYIRRKNFYYSDHAVFTLHHYIFSFILLLMIIGVGKLQSILQWGILKWLLVILGILWPVYLFIGMKRLYGQRFWKTMMKFLMVLFLGFIMLLILFIVFLFISFIF